MKKTTTMLRKGITAITYFTLSVMLILISSCATPYASNGLLGGYSDTALAPDVYKISFQGNGYSTKQRTSDFAVLRAAELTLSHGYRYFGIINQNEGASSMVINTPGYAITNTYGNTSYTTFNLGTSIPLFFPESGLMIRCFTEQPGGGFALDAQFISYSIRTKYNLRTS
jgi:hypothetical protein